MLSVVGQVSKSGIGAGCDESARPDFAKTNLPPMRMWMRMSFEALEMFH